jgi:hypothetical protein
MQVPVSLNPYWLLLKDLSAEEKLSLIELLVKSLQGVSVAKKNAEKSPKENKQNPIQREQMIHYILSYQNEQPSFGDASEWQLREREDREIPR